MTEGKMQENKKKTFMYKADRELKKEFFFLDKFFKLSDNQTNIHTEFFAGLITFMTMAYILAVNPEILSAAGMPKGGVFIATVIAAAVGSALMGFVAKYPFALAPGLGINAFFAYTVVLSMGYSWQFALLAVFVEGILFLILSVVSVREKIFNSIPISLKSGVAVGIGIFIAFIALQGGKIVVANNSTIVGLINFHSVDMHTSGIWAILTLVGIIITSAFLIKEIRGAILLGIFATWLLGIVTEFAGIYVPNPEAGFHSVIPQFGDYLQTLDRSFREFGITCGALFHPESWTLTRGDAIVGQGFSLFKSLDFFVVIFAFFFVDLFDTLGTLIGVSFRGGFLKEDGKLPRISQALSCDAIATSIGAICGTSTTTTYVESAAGVTYGGKTGLTAVSVALFFLLSLLFAPVFMAIPGFATAPALIMVAYFMMTSIAKIDWTNPKESIPAFICMIAMPLTYSISDGIMFGVISYTLINTLTGKIKNVHWVMIVLTAIFLLKYALM